MGFVERSRFERLGVFTYSHEEQTHAHNTLKDELPQEVKEERANTVMALQEGISLELNQQRIGQTYKVLIDRLESGQYVGRTEYDSPEVDNEVVIDATDRYLRIGDFVPVKITDATEFDLYGQPVI